MGKTRPRLASTKLGKRWKKGQSSSSNPETKKHRSQAKSRFGLPDTVSSSTGGLTREAVKKLEIVCANQLMEDNEPSESLEIDEFDEKSSIKTFKTFASNYSNCSNMTFDHFLTNFEKKSNIHQEMLSVLAAVTDIITEKNGTQSTAEYYAALMSSIEQATTKETIVACLALIQMVLKNVSKSLLKFEFKRAAPLIFQILEKFADTEEYQIQRYSIGCLSTLLKNQDPIVWSSSSTFKLFDGILAFVVHIKPKVRKSAQDAICRVLKGSEFMKNDDSPAYHPAASRVAKHCQSILEGVNQQGAITRTLHALTLLKKILHAFPSNYVKSICEELLKIMTLNNTVTTTSCLQTFYDLFVSKPTETVVPAILNAQIINALYDYQPSSGDIQLTEAWLVVMQEAYFNLVAKNVDLCAANLPKIIERIIELWLSDKTQVVTAAANTTKALIQVCMAPMCVDKITALKYKSTLERIIQQMQTGLKYQYEPVWHHVLILIQEVFIVTKDTCAELMAPLINQLIDFRDANKALYNTEIDNAIGAAVRSLGPQFVLSQIPLFSQFSQFISQNSLQTSTEDAYRRKIWLLTVLKQNIRESSLAYFQNLLLPIASICEEIEKKRLGNEERTRIAESPYCQIWETFPSFCSNPIDIKTNFKCIAKRLGQAIDCEKDIRMPVMTSLRKLITRSIENQMNEDIAELARFSHNFLPRLLNLYLIESSDSVIENQKRAAFETIAVYLSISPAEQTGLFFDSAIKQIDDPETKQNTKFLLYDLMQILVQFTNNDRVESLYAKCIPLIKQRVRAKHQKKAYRILGSISGSQSEVCKEFVRINRNRIEKDLHGDAIRKIATLARGARLRCICNLIESHPQLQRTEFLESIIREIVECIKDRNMRCRTTAYKLLDVIASKFLSNYDLFTEFIDLVIVRLEDGNYESAALLALASLVFNNNGFIGIPKVNEILNRSCHFLTVEKRDTVSSALSFIKVFMTSMPILVVGPTIETIINSFSKMTDDCKSHFRQEVKNLLVKLIRKFGIDTITNLVPETDIIMLKQLKNIRKHEARKQKVKEEQRLKMDENNEDDFEFTSKIKSLTIDELINDSDNEIEDIDDDDNNDENKKGKKHQKKNIKQSWIQEKGDEIVDLADPTSARNITRTKPGSLNNINEKQKPKNHGFKMAEDGRFIIDDDDSDDDENTSNKKKPKLPFLGSDTEDDEDNDDNDDSKSVISLKAGKRKRQDDASSVATSKYHAGGSGIHRPTKAPKVEAAPGSEYRSKKAPGDIKKKGKHDPYAYVPLTRAALNKRKKVKTAGRFKNVISGGKKGGKKK